MRDNILRYLRENELIAPGATLVCAVSGGKDSVCLLHVMLSLQRAFHHRRSRAPESPAAGRGIRPRRSVCEKSLQ